MIYCILIIDIKRKIIKFNGNFIFKPFLNFLFNGFKSGIKGLKRT